MTEEKPVLEMNDREWADELQRVSRREFARAVVAREEAETAAYLRKHFPPEGTQDTPEDQADERTDEQKQLEAQVAAEAEAYLARR